MNQNSGQITGRKPNTGPSHPPKNNVTAIAEMTTTWMYSPRKNIANRIPEYSVWNPATSSVSASGRSNGARFVSAMPAMRKIRNAGHCDQMYQLGKYSKTLARCSSPHTPSKNTTSRTDPTCAFDDVDGREAPGGERYRYEGQTQSDLVRDHLRARPDPPISGYLEPDAQPARTTP